MFLEEIKYKIEENKKLIEIIIERWSILDLENKINGIKKIKDDENFWLNKDSTNILKEYKKYEDLNNLYKSIHNKFHSINKIIKEYSEEIDELLKNEIFSEINTNKKEINELSIKLLMNKEDDNKNCYFDINSGAGGTEAQDWAYMIFRMYIRFFERYNYKYNIINYIDGETAGIKSATIFVTGDYIHGLLSCESGIHRLVRISPFDSNKRRHTSFAAVSIMPERNDINIIIDLKDLRIDTYRASGAGGQHVNKTDSAVRITHIPTNIVVQCQNERSQLQNKETSMKMLKAKLYLREKELLEEKKGLIEKKKIEWGSQIRSYVLHPYKMVKDHRTDYESSQCDDVLDGDIMIFIEKYLIIR